MRIISGKFGGRVLDPPKGLPVRPTTDRAREALFNILTNQIDFKGMKVLDLFSGTGAVSIEFLSRGVESVICIDQSPNCARYISKLLEEYGGENSMAIRKDALQYLKECEDKFDLIFMDPPYNYHGYEPVIAAIADQKLLAAKGMLIVEHRNRDNFSHLAGFVDCRKYGKCAFSFFEFP